MNLSPRNIADESGRLAALDRYEILDTDREKDFDDVAELASEICGTPIAVVNLIGDGRQFFKAEVGLGVRETPLDSSFCAKAILEEEFLVVPDATKDSRFDCNPLVTGEPGLRFYAGALLKTEAGHAIGTVCVLDVVPHDLTPLQERSLRVLARQVMKQLDLRLAIRERDRARDQQKLLIQELAHRLKNTLTMVQAIASQTLKNVSERDAVSAFERRVVALGQAHDLLLQENFKAAPVRDVADLVLSPHDRAGRFELVGPEVVIGPKATLALSLILHELATNATKYGSLSKEAGRVRLSWNVSSQNGHDELTVTWSESGGPPADKPNRSGFGSRLIAMGLTGTGGGVQRIYSSSGLAVELKAPLFELQS